MVLKNIDVMPVGTVFTGVVDDNLTVFVLVGRTKDDNGKTIGMDIRPVTLQLGKKPVDDMTTRRRFSKFNKGSGLRRMRHIPMSTEGFPKPILPKVSKEEQLTEEEQNETGVTADYVRVSVGTEHIDDIIADFAQALKASQ